MVYGVILAGGSGKRMNSDIPKQYIDLGGKPVLYYSLYEFSESNVDKIIIVAGENDIDYVKTHIVDKYGIKKVENVIAGGKERYNSVYNSLKAICETDYVLIHDGARPFIKREIINAMIDDVKNNKASIAAVPVKDTIKMTDGNNNIVSTIPRKNLWRIQTPQAFDYKMLFAAYEKVFMNNAQENITDDSMIWEYVYKNIPVKIFVSDYNNFKITTSEDMIYAKALMTDDCGL